MADRRYALLGHSHVGTGAGAAWGDITGTLSGQTDLQSALDLKLEAADLSGYLQASVDETVTGLYSFVNDDGIVVTEETETYSFSFKTDPYWGGAVIAGSDPWNNEYGLYIDAGGQMFLGGGGPVIATPGVVVAGDEFNCAFSFAADDPTSSLFIADIGFFGDDLFQFGQYVQDADFGFYITKDTPTGWIYPFYVDTSAEASYFQQFAVRIGAGGGTWTSGGGAVLPTEYAELKDDGTDFNISLVGLTDLNFSGLTALNVAGQLVLNNTSGDIGCEINHDIDMTTGQSGAMLRLASTLTGSTQGTSLNGIELELTSTRANFTGKFLDLVSNVSGTNSGMEVAHWDITSQKFSGSGTYMLKGDVTFTAVSNTSRVFSHIDLVTNLPDIDTANRSQTIKGVYHYLNAPGHWNNLSNVYKTNMYGFHSRILTDPTSDHNVRGLYVQMDTDSVDHFGIYQEGAVSNYLEGNLSVGSYLRVANSAQTDWGEQSHNGTDFNWDFTNTTDLNVTGITAVKLQKKSATSQMRLDFANELGQTRYLFGLTSTTDDDFFIGLFNDAGGYVGNPLYMDGITGNVIFGFDVSVTGDLTGSNLNIANWDTAFGWGNHASGGYLTAEADTLATVTGRGATTTTPITVRTPLNISSGGGAATYLQWEDSTEATRWRMGCDGGGSENFIIYDDGQAATIFSIDDATGDFTFNRDVNVTDLYGNVPSVARNKTASYTMVLGDAGQLVRFTGATASKVCTIPANASVAYPIGTMIGVTNDGSATMTLAITTDTLTWGKDNTTGTRTLAAGADCVILKTTATTWKINGSALVT